MSVATAELPGTDAEKLALVFPGQGSQYVGMGKALYEASSAARRVFHQADDVLGFKLSQLCFEGPADELEDTINAQPAILTVSLACLAAIREKVEALGQNWQPPRYMAGHSLGEYTALVAAGVLEFSDALRLVRERGRLMKEQGNTRPGGMAAVVGLDREALDRACRDASCETGRIVSVANANSPEQFVISGELMALDRAIALVRERGARTVVPLRISIASHSPLMQQAAARLADLIDRSPLRDPQVPVVTNIAGQVRTSADHIRGELASQMVAPVEWVGSVRAMVANGVDTFVEIGPGQVLSRLIKRISSDVRAISLNDAYVALLGKPGPGK
ncbi:MAG TPA: ACP S-malonyltransferase [Chloroflexota bacterium]|nr:ACP S-malonyltransferase [Chloroflexota bacterium]